MKYDLVKIAVGRRKIIPHAAHIVEGTEGLLAITKETEDSEWVVTHIASGYAFAGTESSTKSTCIRYAKHIFEKYPKCRLREKTAKAVVGNWSLKRFRKMLEIA